ncbi:CHRD domain-containing protein [Armatimonas sp.]|uniref:CHRD domain-containing protein n=1 Tax=Armatimonas sp. TaxID=1872638 RepID=UPI00374FE729
MLTRRVLCALFALSGALFAGCGSNSGVVPTDYFTTTLLGSQEVPANSAPGVGTASVSTVDGKTRVVVDLLGLTGTITGAHIHVGAPGVNGSIVLNLLTGTGTGTRDTSKPGELHIDFKYDAAVSGLSNKTHYINVHTGLNPGGELRGDLVKA